MKHNITASADRREIKLDYILIDKEEKADPGFWCILMDPFSSLPYR
jgi:hypothetical protein